MKLLRLIGMNIKRMATKHTLTLVLLILGLTVSCTAAATYYMMATSAGSVADRMYDVDRSVDLLVGGILTSRQGYDIVIDFAENSGGVVTRMSLYSDTVDEYDVIGIRGDIPEAISLLAGRAIEDSNEAVIPLSLAGGSAQNALSTSFTIPDGGTYTVVGVYEDELYSASMFNSMRLSKEEYEAAGVVLDEEQYMLTARDCPAVFITMDNLIDSGLGGYVMRILYADPVIREDAMKFSENLSLTLIAATGEQVAVLTEAMETAAEVTGANFLAQMIMYVSVSLLSLINAVLLFVFIIRKNRRQYILFKLTGATNSKLIAVILAEAFVYTLVSYTLGWFLSCAVVQTKVFKLTPVPTLGKYFTVLGIVLAVVLTSVLVLSLDILGGKVRQKERADRQLAAVPQYKKLYLLNKSYSGRVFSEIVLFLLIFFTASAFTFAAAYFYERNATARYADKYLSGSETIYLSIDQEKYGELCGDYYWEEKFAPLQELYKELSSIKGAQLGIANRTALGARNVDVNAMCEIIASGGTVDRPTDRPAGLIFKELNTAMIEHVSLPLKSGRWLNDWADGVDITKDAYVPIIISFEMAEEYGFKVGSEFDMYLEKTVYFKVTEPAPGGGYTDAESEQEYYPITLRVVGIYGLNSRLLELGVYPIQFDLSFPYCYDLVHDYGQSTDDVYCPILYMDGQPIIYPQAVTCDCLFFMDGTVPSETLVQQLSEYGEAVTMTAFAAKKDDSFKAGTNEYLVHGAIAAALLIIGVAGYNLLSLERQKRQLGIYFACGMPWREAVSTSLIANGVIFLTGGIAGSLFGLFFVNDIRPMMRDTNLFSVLSAVGIIVVLFFATSISMIVQILKTQPVSLIKKGD